MFICVRYELGRSLRIAWVFREYAQWFKGKHQLVWSAGLRSRLLDGEEEPSDLDLAEQPEEETKLLGRLTQAQWRIVLVHDARGKLLEVARYGDWQMVVAFLADIDGYGPSPPMSLGFPTRLASLCPVREPLQHQADEKWHQCLDGNPEMVEQMNNVRHIASPF